MEGKQEHIRRILRVCVLSDDPFAQNWMSQLLMRDWRTRVVAEPDSLEELKSVICKSESGLLDAIVIDLDNLNADLFVVFQLLDEYLNDEKRILLTKKANPNLCTLLRDPHVGGILIKNEVEISLGWAVDCSLDGNLVITKSIEKLFLEKKIKVNSMCIVFEGLEANEFLTPTENRNARLAFVLSMSRGNMADELAITPKSSWTLISHLYESMGLNDLLEGNDWVQFNLEDSQVIRAHLVKESAHKLRTDAHSAKETLAFHLYSKPKMRYFGKC